MKTEKDVKIDQEKTRIKEEIDFFAELSDDPKFIKTFMFQILKAHNEGSRNLFRFLIKKLGETPKVNPILGKKIGSLIKEYINYSFYQTEVEVLEPNISPISTQGIADIMKDLEEEDDLEDEKEDIDDLEKEEWDENDDDDPDPDLDDEDRRAQDIDEIFEDEEDEEEEKPPEVIDRGYTELVSNSKVVKPESIVKPTRPVNPRKTVRIKTRKL